MYACVCVCVCERERDRETPGPSSTSRALRVFEGYLPAATCLTCALPVGGRGHGLCEGAWAVRACMGLAYEQQSPKAAKGVLGSQHTFQTTLVSCFAVCRKQCCDSTLWMMQGHFAAA